MLSVSHREQKNQHVTDRGPCTTPRERGDKKMGLLQKKGGGPTCEGVMYGQRNKKHILEKGRGEERGRFFVPD